jgi:hypothetical protein
MAAEIIAKLGLDSSRFQAGLTQANVSFQRFTQVVKAGRIGGGLGALLGAGGIIQGFRATINAAQEARDKAAELGCTVDEGTSAVARYGDAWDRIKRTITETAISGLGLVVRSGEAVGEFVNDQLASRLRGMTPDQAKRTREISETAAANADRLSSPAAMAAARARGEARKAADEQQMREVSRLMNDATERRQEAALREKPLAEQVVVLEEKRNTLLKEFNNGRATVLVRAKAFAEAAKIEEKIAERRRDIEKQTAAEQERQAKARATALEEERRQRTLAEREQAARFANEEARRNAQRQLDASTAFAGEMLAGGRVGRRSERERLADRATASRARAEDAVRTGASPGYVAQLARAAARDLAKVGGKTGQSTSLVSRGDADALGSPLLSTNKILSEIRDNLKPTKTNSGGSK